jgi:hypothetical protein
MSTTSDRTFASRDKTISSATKYEQVTKGGGTIGYDEKYTSVEGSFHPDLGLARVNIEVIDTVGKRRLSRMGGINLKEADAVALAMSILPPSYAQALAEHAAALKAASK